MPTDPDQPLIKPSDARAWASCVRRVWFDNLDGHAVAASGDAFEQLIVQRGIEHETHILNDISRNLPVETATSVADTARLMAEHTPVIYQAQLMDESKGIFGKPDFLLLHDSGEYQAADAKLSFDPTKKDILIQLGLYRRLLRNELPAIVFHGNGNQSSLDGETDAVTEAFIAEMRQLLSSESMPDVRYGHSKCRACPYYGQCKVQFEATGELSLLYGVDGRAVPGLLAAGIDSIETLAKCAPESIPDIPWLKKADKKKRAVLQANSTLTGEIIQLSAVELPEGHWVHFDIEDNPLTTDGEKHVYLWGFLEPDTTGACRDGNFEYVWTNDQRDDEAGWLQFLDRIKSYQQAHTDLKLVHFSPHERTTILQYANRYGMENHPIVSSLLDTEGPLFDLREPVRKSLVLPLQGYGLKDICKHPDLVNFQWADDESGSQWSVVQFNRFLSEPDPGVREHLKHQILSYNRDDVTATRRLELWLRETFNIFP